MTITLTAAMRLWETASMGPVWVRPDDRRNTRHTVARGTASMGPVWVRPDDDYGGVVCDESIILLQWGRSGLDRMTVDVYLGLNVDRLKLQWGRSGLDRMTV